MIKVLFRTEMCGPSGRQAGAISNTIDVNAFREAVLSKPPQSSERLQEKLDLLDPPELVRRYEELKFTPFEARSFIVKGPIPKPHVCPPPIAYDCGDYYPEFASIFKAREIIQRSGKGNITIETGIHKITVNKSKLKGFILWSIAAHYQLSNHELQEATPELLIALASRLNLINKGDENYFLVSGEVHPGLLFHDIFTKSIAAQNIFFNLKKEEIEPAIKRYIIRGSTQKLKALSA